MYSLDDLSLAFEEAGLGHLFEKLERYAKNSIKIDLDPKVKTDKIGNSRFGGNPDLPLEMDWPHNEDSGDPLNFIAQLNMEDFKTLDIGNKLPSQGILYFFYDLEAFLWGFDKKDMLGSLVYYYDGPLENLVNSPCPDKIQAFNPSGLKFSQVLDLPEYSSQLIQTQVSDEDYERYLDLVDDLELYADHKLLGHSNNIQNGMELQCELVRNGIYCGSSEAYQDPRLPELAPGRFDWNLLFQISSNEATGMEFGNEGSLYFWIRNEDLEVRRFDRSWQILQSY